MYCLELATNAGIVFSSPTSQTRNYYQFYLDLFCSLPFVQHWKNDHNDRIAEQKKRVKKKLLHKNDSTKKSTFFFCLFYLFPSSQCIILYKPNYIAQWFTGKAGQKKLSGSS